MKILAFVLSIFVSTALVLGGTFLLVFAMPSGNNWTILLGTLALTGLVYGPLTLGSMTAYWDFRSDDATRRLLGRSCRIICSVEALSVVAIVIYAILNGSPWWLPVLFGVGGVALTVLASLLGPTLLRREMATRSEVVDWLPVTHAQIVRKAVTVAVTFVAFLVVAVIALVVAFAATGKAPSHLGSEVALGAALAFIAGAFACIIVSLPLNRLLRESTNRNPVLLRKIAKVVLRGKSVELNDGERIAAVKYAHIASLTLPFQLAYIGMLYAGLAINQLQQLSGDLGLFSIIFLIGLIAVFVWFFPLTVVRIRRARRYALANEGLLGQPVVASTSA